MARRNFFRTQEFPYHLTARANNREDFPALARFIWKTFTGELFIQQVLHGLKVHEFVLMPNHFHLLASSANRDMNLVMRDFLSSSTRIINHRTRRSGRIFGGPFHWSVVGDARYYAHVTKYVIRNPVKAGLAGSVAEYQFSTYSCALGLSPLTVRLSRPSGSLDRLIPRDVQERDTWLNRPHPYEINEAIRKGLRRKDFQIKPDAISRRKLDLSI
jgi:putative transposase